MSGLPRRRTGEQVTEFKAMVQRFHQRRHRGSPRRGLQPYRRGESSRTDSVLSRGGQRHLLPARIPRIRASMPISPAAATPWTCGTRRPGSWCSTVSGTGSRRCTWTAFASISRRCSARDDTGFNPAGRVFRAAAAGSDVSQDKLIAEPWDLGPDGYQVGTIPAGLERVERPIPDTVRHFWRGDTGQVGDLASRLSGSSDLFARNGRAPQASVNFVTCHDGFTLQDLVSYETKHNEANGEEQPGRHQPQPEPQLGSGRAGRDHPNHAGCGSGSSGISWPRSPSLRACP